MWYIDDPAPPLWVKILLFLAALVLIWILGFFSKRSVRRIRRNVASEANNGIDLGISIIQFLILIIAFWFIFEVDSTAVLGMSALFGTAIGFAMGVVIGNIVAGFYLIAVRPFGIGDLIMVKGSTGIVLEIGLNYSRLLSLDRSTIIIPNKSLLDANLINCSIQVKDLEERASKGFEAGLQSLLDEIHEMQEKSGKQSTDLADEVLGEITGGREIVQFPFTVQLKLNIISPDIPLARVSERLDALCDQWEEKLGYRPRYFYNKYVFRQDVRMVLVVDHPHQILNEYPNFLEEVYRSVFVELQEVEA